MALVDSRINYCDYFVYSTTAINLNETDEVGLEKALNPERDNVIKNPKLMNEVKQPVRIKATGQGSDGLLNINKDMPIYNNGGDNFINTTDWNTN